MQGRGRVSKDDCSLKRVAKAIRFVAVQSIQFTPGSSATDIWVRRFIIERWDVRVSSGPIFDHVLLADEINRASRGSSALLEAMSEMQVHDRRSSNTNLPSPFLCSRPRTRSNSMARPPLPEAQPDRFLGQIELGYPGCGKTGSAKSCTLTAFPDPLDGLPNGTQSRNDVVQFQSQVRTFVRKSRLATSSRSFVRLATTGD